MIRTLPGDKEAEFSNLGGVVEEIHLPAGGIIKEGTPPPPPTQSTRILSRVLWIWIWIWIRIRNLDPYPGGPTNIEKS